MTTNIDADRTSCMAAFYLPANRPALIRGLPTSKRHPEPHIDVKFVTHHQPQNKKTANVEITVD
ncbi:hypothetical protein AJ79_09258 [Helicocarpus griseus UAMH5409]|uniref:Uncharacterized protein n=1 Tax=Helicocarpus griseus UAMH5409 TaxID=1447875 RepID=A0A2B7WL52_9EURO|nr:hypothetical protein AJ79_09258 [Helicocarpus griseus UAMH5409]